MFKKFFKMDNKTRDKKYLYFILVTLLFLGIFLGARLSYFADDKIQEKTTLLFRKEYEDSDVVKYYDDEDPPEIFNSFNFEGFKKDELKDFLPESWEVEEFSNDLVSLVYKGKKYKENMAKSDEDETREEINYIGIYKDRIAIYESNPEDEELIEVTPYKVKDVYKEDLEKGVPFTTEEEKIRILESYTS